MELKMLGILPVMRAVLGTTRALEQMGHLRVALNLIMKARQKTNFQMNSFALSLAFVIRFKGTRIWPITGTEAPNGETKLLKCTKQ